VEVAKTGKPSSKRFFTAGWPAASKGQSRATPDGAGWRVVGVVRGSVETLHHPPGLAGGLAVGRYGEEKVRTPNPGWLGAVKAAAGENQWVVGSNPSAGSILWFAGGV